MFINEWIQREHVEQLWEELLNINPLMALVIRAKADTWDGEGDPGLELEEEDAMHMAKCALYQKVTGKQIFHRKSPAFVEIHERGLAVEFIKEIRRMPDDVFSGLQDGLNAVAEGYADYVFEDEQAEAMHNAAMRVLIKENFEQLAGKPMIEDFRDFLAQCGPEHVEHFADDKDSEIENALFSMIMNEFDK